MEWGAYLLTLIGAVLGGLVILYSVAGYYHVKYYIRRREHPEAWKCQPRRFLRAEQQRQAMWLSTRNLTIGGLLSGTYIHAISLGLPTPIYFDVSDHGWLYTIFSALLLFVVTDGLAYYAHRALHYKPLFKRIHHVHHRFVATTPWVAVAMHPVEFLIFQAVTFAPLFVFPVHYLGAIAVLVYALAFNIIDHSGVRLSSRWPWQGPTTYHDDHHAHFHCNFGQHLMLWDRLHGTLRRVGRRYGADVYGGRGSGGSSGDEFVRYE